MLATFLIWIYVSFLTLAYGLLFIKNFPIKIRQQKNRLAFLVWILLAGLSILIFLVTLLSLFTKIGLLANIIILLGAIILALRYRADLTLIMKLAVNSIREMNKLALVIYLLVLIFIFLRTTDTPISYDTGLYHVQAIRWVEEYRAVPGLVNLHARFGYDSAWFVITSFFSLSFLKIQSFHTLNGWLFCLILLILADGLSQLLKKDFSISASAKYLILIFFFFNLLSFGVAPPNPDVAAAIFIWSVVLLTLERMDDANLDDRLFAFTAVLLAATAVMIKISALPIILLIIISFFSQRSLFRKIRIRWLALFGLSLFLPLVLRNIIISGYLFFPLPFLRLNFLGWAPSEAAAKSELLSIVAWARMPGFPIADVMQRSFTDWFFFWLNTQNNFNRLVFFADIILVIYHIPLMIFSLAPRSKWRELFCVYRPIHLALVCGFLYWFFSAPDPRFGYGFISSLLILLLTPAFLWLLKKYFVITIGFSLVLLLLFAYITLVNQGKDIRIYLSDQLLYPLPYPSKTMEKYKIEGHDVYAPADGSQECWYSQLPCANGKDPVLKFNGSSIRHGFNRLR